jgi:hypothetical protein
VQYSGAGKDKPLPTLLVTVTGAIDRGACIAELSQYPGEVSETCEGDGICAGQVCIRRGLTVSCCFVETCLGRMALLSWQSSTEKRTLNPRKSVLQSAALMRGYVHVSNHHTRGSSVYTYVTSMPVKDESRPRKALSMNLKHTVYSHTTC